MTHLGLGLGEARSVLADPVLLVRLPLLLAPLPVLCRLLLLVGLVGVDSTIFIAFFK